MTSLIESLLEQHADARTRTVDDHMFTVERPGYSPATFRLQLFTAPGVHPVAVATQTDQEGTSLVNAAETYAAEVWRRHCPDESEPPIWIERQLLGDSTFNRFALVTFTLTGPFELCCPEWGRITEAELTRLVGGAVDPDRGDGYVPRPPEPEDEPRFRTIWTMRLPRPHPFRAKTCMPTGISWARRIARQLAPRHQARPCCWYHGGDWHRVSATAIRLVRQAQHAGVAAHDIHDFVRDAAQAEGLSGWELDALHTLVCPGDGIQLTVPAGHRRTFYINGQHKSQALLDAGVRRTIVIDWVAPTPTG
ncbi:hypothetical protein [Nonomuraea sp. 10N515B]|uniref:hypothetical protein n=1 Tax=Nonomuraea sp. 10N515B TaxID=3457422 RepID=UPI003FCD55A2